MPGANTDTGFSASLRRSTDFIVVFAIVAVVLMIVVPLPPFLLDMLLVTNLALALVVLIVTMYAKEPLQFSTFPTLLLIVTVFRLALNISATGLS